MSIDETLKNNLIADVENILSMNISDENIELLKRCFEITIGHHYAAQFKSNVTDEQIEKWARLEAFGDISDKTFKDEEKEHSIQYFRYKSLIKGAKALRDNKIK